MLSIIIVSYNVKYFLEQCLYSVQKAAAGLDVETIVIDNCSPDNSVAYLQPKFPLVRFIVNTKNVGFGAANNQGWKIAKGEFILFLNPDTILSEDSLHKTLLQFNHPETGAVGIRMVDGGGHFLPESKRGFPSPSTSFYKLSGLTALFPKSKRFARYYLGHLPADKTNAVDVLAGAFMMVRKSILEKLGGFDETFFMYGEDVDLSYRIQQLGFHNIYFADSSIIHFKGESTKKDFKYVRHFYEAMSIFVRKHYGKQSWWLVIGLQAAIALRAVFAFTGKLFSSKKTNPVVSRELKVLVVADEAEALSVMTILNNYKNIVSIQRVAINQPIKPILKVSAIDNLVLCAGHLSYSGIILLLQSIGNHSNCLIHTVGSGSVVGSHSKNSAGEIMAMP